MVLEKKSNFLNKILYRTMYYNDKVFWQEKKNISQKSDFFQNYIVLFE